VTERRVLARRSAHPLRVETALQQVGSIDGRCQTLLQYFRKRGIMKARCALLVALAAAVTLTSGAAAGPEAARQQVEITASGVANPASSLRFVLTPVGSGALKPDSGTETSTYTSHVVVREGQRVEIANWVTTCKGKRGSFVLRVRIEHIDAGNGFHIGTGTWRFVRGTGAYAGITGGGRVANAWVDRGSRALSERRDGFLKLP
jgi:hypothetical protein